MPQIVGNDHIEASRRFKEIMATYSEAEDLINIGAYAKGTNPKIDDAIERYPKYMAFLSQGMHDKSTFSQAVNELKTISK